MDDSPSTSGATATAEFYLPATFQFRNAPGRIERFLGRVLGRRDRVEGFTVGTADREFYLPATPDVAPARSR